MRQILLTIALTLFLSSLTFTKATRRLEVIEPACTARWYDYRDNNDCKAMGDSSELCEAIASGAKTFNKISGQYAPISPPQLACVAMNNKQIDWVKDLRDAEKENCQIACCGLRTKTIHWHGLSENVQRTCDVGSCMARGSRRLLKTNVKTQRKLAGYGTAPRCNSKTTFFDYRENHYCECGLDWEDTSEVRNAVFSLQAGAKWSSLSEEMRKQPKVVCAGLDAKQMT